MSMHENDITARLSRFLERKSAPLRLRTQTAQDDEMRVLIGKITSHAPRHHEALAAWWPIFESELGDFCGDFWPSEKHIKPAAKVATQQMPKVVGPAFDGQDMRDVAIIARKMAANEAVGENWFWGRGAVELGAERLVSPEIMERYRQAAFLNRVGHGHPSEDARQTALAKAREWEAEAKARHEDAKQLWRDRGEPRQQRDIQMPNMAAE